MARWDRVRRPSKAPVGGETTAACRVAKGEMSPVGTTIVEFMAAHCRCLCRGNPGMMTPYLTPDVVTSDRRPPLDPGALAVGVSIPQGTCGRSNANTPFTLVDRISKTASRMKGAPMPAVTSAPGDGEWLCVAEFDRRTAYVSTNVGDLAETDSGRGVRHAFSPRPANHHGQRNGPPTVIVGAARRECAGAELVGTLVNRLVQRKRIWTTLQTKERSWRDAQVRLCSAYPKKWIIS